MQISLEQCRGEITLFILNNSCESKPQTCVEIGKKFGVVVDAGPQWDITEQRAQSFVLQHTRILHPQQSTHVCNINIDKQTDVSIAVYSQNDKPNCFVFNSDPV